MPPKQCGRCKATKPVEEFHRCSSAKDGLYWMCKECAREKGRQYYQANKAKVDARARVWVKANPEKSRAYTRKHAQKNRPAKQAAARAKRREFPAETRAQDRRYREANPESYRKARKKHYYSHLEQSRQIQRDSKRKARVADPEHERETHRRYRARNRLKIAIKESNRRARVRGLGRLTLAQIHTVFDRYGWRCCNCLSSDQLEIDHIVPVSKDGPNEPSNIQPLCRSCNASKSARTIDYRQVVGYA